MACAGDAHACALAERHSNHIALMVLSVVLPVGLALITLLLRAVAGRPAGRLGWARLLHAAVNKRGLTPFIQPAP